MIWTAWKGSYRGNRAERQGKMKYSNSSGKRRVTGHSGGSMDKFIFAGTKKKRKKVGKK